MTGLLGSVRAGTELSVHTFSGTLELMRVFEELLPAHHVEAALDSARLPRGEGGA